MIFVIDDDEIMSECVKKACGGTAKVFCFNNAIEAMAEIDKTGVPNLIFLDILLDGPDGFTFLNELLSYSDTGRIPVVVVTSLNLEEKDLSEYGVVGVLDKDTMKPEEIFDYVEKYSN